MLELTVPDNMKSETKYVAEMTRLLAKGKVKAPVYFEVGKTFGMACKEVCEARKKHFSGEMKTPAKAKAAKAVKEILGDAAELNGDYGSPEVEDNSEPVGPPPDFGVVIDTPDEFVWIATPEEIKNPSDLHATNYIID